MLGWRWADIEGDLGVPLVFLGPKVGQNRHVFDQPQCECAEVISTLLAGRDHQNVLGGVQQELVAHEGRGDIGLTNPTEGFHD